MKAALSALILTLIVGSLFAQSLSLADNRSGIVKGTVVDSKGNIPIGYANVLLKRQKDSSFVKGVATGVTGEFLLGNVDAGKYFVTVSFVGYQRKSISSIDLDGTSTKEINLGTIKLDASTVSMQAVQVTGERAEEEFRPDKKVINVAKNLQAVGGTAIDALRNQPSVQVDSDGNLTLRGSGNYTVLVNGRPTPLQGSDALRQIPATMIDNIELITNPSAKYDAEGAIGIININLKNSNEYTMSGLTNVGIGTRNKYNGDASVSMNFEKFSLNAGFDYRSTMMYQPMTMERSSSGISGEMSATTDMYRSLKRDSRNFRIGVDFRPGSQHQLTLNGTYGKLGFSGNWYSKVKSSIDGNMSFAYIDNRIDVPAEYSNAQFFYTYKIIPSVEELSFEATYSHLLLPNKQTTDEYLSDASFMLRGASPLLQQLNNEATRNDGRIKLNFSHKYSPRSTLEAGVQSTLSYREYDAAYSLFSWGTNSWVNGNGLNNTFNFHQNIHAAFVTYSNSIAEFDVQAGVRAEYMDRLLDIAVVSKQYALQKLDYFPSFSVSRKIGEHAFQLSYSRRITRPNEGLLNPVPFYTDSYLRITGNPELLPEYVNSFELNYQKIYSGIFVNVQTYLRTSRGSVLQTQTVEPDGRLAWGLHNLGSSSTMGAELSSSFSLGTIWKFDPSATVYHSSQKGVLFNESFNTKATSWNARLNTTASVTPTTKIQLTGNYFGKQLLGQSVFQPRFLLGISIRQEFLERQLSLAISGQNLLKTANMTLENVSSNLRTSTFLRPELQMVNLTLSYNFNNFKRSATQNVDIGTDIGR